MYFCLIKFLNQEKKIILAGWRNESDSFMLLRQLIIYSTSPFIRGPIYKNDWKVCIDFQHLKKSAAHHFHLKLVFDSH